MSQPLVVLVSTICFWAHISGIFKIIRTPEIAFCNMVRVLVLILLRGRGFNFHIQCIPCNMVIVSFNGKDAI